MALNFDDKTQDSDNSSVWNESASEESNSESETDDLDTA